MYISRALTKTQQRYSNIEQELLAIVMVTEQLHHYLFGRSFTVHTDHSPLVQIFAKQLNDVFTKTTTYVAKTEPVSV